MIIVPAQPKKGQDLINEREDEAFAGMAEWADASVSKTDGGNSVRVRLPLPARFTSFLNSSAESKGKSLSQGNVGTNKDKNCNLRLQICFDSLSRHVKGNRGKIFSSIKVKN